MNKTADLTIDRMPSITWRWLKLNDRHVKVTTDGTAAAASVTAPEAFSVNQEAFPEVDGGAGTQFETFLQDAEPEVYSVAAGVQEDKPARLNFDFEAGAHTVNKYGVVLGDNAKATFIMDFRSDKDAEGSAGLQTSILVGKNASLTFVQIHRAGDNFHIINDVGAELEEKAQLQIIHVIFSGKETDIGAKVLLKGDDASYDCQVGYLVEKDHRVDLNYTTPYVGKRGASNLVVSGVLRDEAKKIFRGTIDFKRGCEDSTGDENENVLLMNDHVINQSVPVILCDEENVEGNHGASIGKLDDSLLFYLESRGIAYEDIYEMMAKAKLETIFSRIPDEDIVNELREYTEGAAI